MTTLNKLVGTGAWGDHAREVLGSVATGLTAAGTTQTTALALTADVNSVGTTALSSGVILPATASQSDTVVVFNGGANALEVYPPVGGTINGGATNAGVSLATLKGAEFRCVAASGGLTWIAILSA